MLGLKLYHLSKRGHWWLLVITVRVRLLMCCRCRFSVITLKAQFIGPTWGPSGSCRPQVHGSNMGPIWGRQEPGWPHVGPMNFAIWEDSKCRDISPEPRLNTKTVFLVWISILKIRLSHGRLIFVIGIPILVRRHINIETAPRFRRFFWHHPIQDDTELLIFKKPWMTKCNFPVTIATLDSLPPLSYDDGIEWKHFPRYCPFVRGIHPSPVNSPHKSHCRGALMLLWYAPEQADQQTVEIKLFLNAIALIVTSL